MGEKSGKREKSKKSKSLSFLALALSRFNPIRFALCAERYASLGQPTAGPF
jgi:hypothetical protein